MTVLLAKQMVHVMQLLHVPMELKQIRLRIVNLVHMTSQPLVHLLVMQRGKHLERPVRL